MNGWTAFWALNAVVIATGMASRIGSVEDAVNSFLGFGFAGTIAALGRSL